MKPGAVAGGAVESSATITIHEPGSSSTDHPNEAPSEGQQSPARWRLPKHLARVVSPPLPFDTALEDEYVRFKYKGIWMPHIWSSIAVWCHTLIFAVLWRDDASLTGTSFPASYWLRLSMYGSCGLVMIAVASLFYLAPRRAVRHGIAIHLFVGLYGVSILCFDPSRILRLLGTSYARELEKWYVLYQPEVSSGCGGYVILHGNHSTLLHAADGHLQVWGKGCPSPQGGWGGKGVRAGPEQLASVDGAPEASS